MPLQTILSLAVVKFLSRQGRNHIFLKYEGECKDGKEWNGTEYDNNGNILGKLVNGEWIKN
jgi:hypothetical protein